MFQNAVMFSWLASKFLVRQTLKTTLDGKPQVILSKGVVVLATLIAHMLK